ncbi:hypothetical protein [Methylomicrobium sp. Wu6]|uniref:hypothetical protein n=1 Tax=Methylomicrobium sp. Wu6 TaxID=3107928 RepID=UPI002DD62D5C|nr:hypothetical protein [Methylomicrobium sp. Wu6]MEC4746938.1 hypothetical protein [Methylomicrobium sp. Wu6]
MARSKERKPKGEVRWDSAGNAGWWRDKPYAVINKDYAEYVLTGHLPSKKNNHGRLEKSVRNVPKLLDKFDDPDFVAAIVDVEDRYLSMKYRRDKLSPTTGDMRETLLDLQEKENKVGQLAEISRCHEIWSIFENAYYAETKKMVGSAFLDRIHDLNRYHWELESTPADHPARQIVQERWDRDHKSNFEMMNNDLIPTFIEISLKHLENAHFEELANSASNDRWLAWNLGIVLKRFGIKPSQTKDGPLCNCLRIVFAAVGRSKESVHHDITKEILRELKRM